MSMTEYFCQSSMWPQYADDACLHIEYDYTPAWTSRLRGRAQVEPDTDADVEISNIQDADGQLDWAQLTQAQRDSITQACFDHAAAIRSK